MFLPVVLVLRGNKVPLQRGLPSKVMLVSAVRVRCLFWQLLTAHKRKAEQLLWGTV